jgi:hypothetical protein
MENGKYIVVEYWTCDFVAIIFPPFLDHAEFVRRLGFSPEDIASAGFVDFGTDPKTGNPCVSCHGRSSSLKKDSNPDRDSKLCTRLFKDTTFYD